MCDACEETAKKEKKGRQFANCPRVALHVVWQVPCSMLHDRRCFVADLCLSSRIQVEPVEISEERPRTGRPAVPAEYQQRTLEPNPQAAAGL